MAEEPREASQQRPEEPATGGEPALDVAGQSLARALRLSFSILTVLIAFLAVAFLMRGCFAVPPDEMAIVLLYGKTDVNMVKDGGFHWSLPYPIEEVARVSVKQRSLAVNTFWPKVQEQEKQDAAEGKQEPPRPVPGAEDGMLLTGDLNVLEARWDVRYGVKPDAKSVIAYYNIIGIEEGELDDETKRFRKERLVVTAALQSAVVREIARMGVLDAYQKDKVLLTERVKSTASKTIEKLGCGIEIRAVTLNEIRPPKEAREAFDAFLNAQNELPTMLRNAAAARFKTLNEAAGPNGEKLGKAISDWWEAKDSGNERKQREIAKTIETLFQDKDTRGKVADAILQAKADKKTIIDQTKGDCDRMKELLKHPEAMDVFAEHFRIDLLGDVLAQCLEKWVLPPPQDGQDRVLRIQMGRRNELVLEKIKGTR